MKKYFCFILVVLAISFSATNVWAAWAERTVYVKFFSQRDSRWANDVMVAPYKIKDSGCAITSVAQVLTYYYISTNPQKFNNWLKMNGGYTRKAGIYWRAVSQYSGGKVVASYSTSNCWDKTRSEVLSGRPCVIKTYLHGQYHWVVARGYEKGKFTINDPLYTSFKLLQYSGTIYAVVTFSHKVNPGLNVIFNECRTRNGGVSKVGYPVNNYHKWGSLTVRDYKHGSYGWCIMTYLYPNAGVRKCYLVRTGFWEKWRQLGGPYSFLGMPITDEYSSFRYGGRARQDFADGGYMVWYGDHVRIYNWRHTCIYASPSLTESPAPKSEIAIVSVSPNPFNPRVTISFNLPEASSVRLEIYNVLGQRIRTLANQPFSAGKHNLVWQAKDDVGFQVASGIYFVRLTSQSAVCTRKLVLLK